MCDNDNTYKQFYLVSEASLNILEAGPNCDILSCESPAGYLRSELQTIIISGTLTAGREWPALNES